jgi:hypothetical protein
VSPVDGSRHYSGRGLGEIGVWGCPACGEDNTGPLTQGCVHCGAGRPAAASAPPPTPPPPAAPPLHDDDHAYNGDLADRWAATHRSASIAEAYRAGYLDGVQAARAAQPATPPPPEVTVGSTRMNRTIIAALTLLRSQVLVDVEDERPDWLTTQEVDTFIRRLQLELPEEVHA